MTGTLRINGLTVPPPPHTPTPKKINPVLVGLLSEGSSNVCCVGLLVITVRFIMRRGNVVALLVAFLVSYLQGCFLLRSDVLLFCVVPEVLNTGPGQRDATVLKGKRWHGSM